MEALVRSIHVYPIKSCRGCDLSEADVLERGFKHDRSWLLVSRAGLAVTQRDFPRMALLHAQMIDEETFRPNIVVGGCEAFAEDTWKRFRICDLLFDVVKPCARCVIVTIDQDDAIGSKEPLRTLSGYRQVGTKVMFGQNLVHHSNGRIRVGDRIEVIEFKT